jgi:hypothetical protein
MFFEGEIWHILYKGSVQGVLTGLASGIMFGMRTRVNWASSNMSMYLVPYTFLVGAGASLITDVAGKLIHEELHVSEKAESEIATALGVAISGIVYYSGLKLLQPESANEIGWLKSFVIGGGAEYVASLTNNLMLA